MTVTRNLCYAKNRFKKIHMKIALGSDHAGFKLKERIKKFLEKKEIDFKDFGCFSEESCDYPDIAKPVALSVASGDFQLGILICGTGIGMSMAANKIKGIRAGLCLTSKMARLTREHNDANILCLGARLMTIKEALKILAVFLRTDFLAGRHLRRVNKINRLTDKNSPQVLA